jgi:hypothetical protein
MDTRKHDKQIINKGLAHPDANIRKQARIAMEKINKEDSWTKSARERLVKESINHNVANIKDVGDEIVKHEGRKDNRGKVSFSFSFPEGFFRNG